MQPKVSLIISGNLYMRQMRFEKGDIEIGHRHTYDHLTLLSTGSMKLTVEGVETIFEAPTAIKILANKVHELEALEDNTMAYCVHALRDAQTEDVLPPQTHLTDAKTKAFESVEGGILVKPSPKAMRVGDQEVEVAPIAYIPHSELKADNLNRTKDDNPLKVKLPDGSDDGISFV